MTRQSALVPADDDPQPALAWQIFHDDRFDRETPATVEVEGRGLVPGLAELWARFLYETMQTSSTWRDGKVEELPSRGYSEFTLIGEQLRVELDGSLVGAYRLKTWMFPVPSRTGIVEGAETKLLRVLAEAHARSGSISEAAMVILDEAEATQERDAFEVRLVQLWR